MPSMEQTPVKKTRCGQCRVRLTVQAYSCKCAKEFCINHLPASEHACTYNYRIEGRQQLTKQLDTSGLAVKLEKI